IKNALLSTISQLQWAGVNTRGCVAVISVQERSGEMTAENPQGICSLISIRDGYILSATATKGNLLVQPGNTVQKGQVLISGYTDCGLSIRAEYAQGEVHAQTSRVLQAVMPRKWLLHVPEGAEKKKYSLLIGKKRINLWKDSGISPSTCGRMYKEYYITLPGGFQLPAAICIDTYTERSVEPVILQQEDAADSLYGFASDYLIQQMIAGQILHREVHLTEAEDCFYFLGTYICQEMIARVRLEQIGDIHGENHRTDR
ncbi:MAG: sporulation protein YqfD, partial [Oscillospiraceae bacterium]|nr:sporulation protein YqfD [Oscillospiraceae bacterium]